MNAICLVCGTEFVVKHSTAGKYCSQACFHKANKGSEHKKRTPKKVCPTCGKEFYPKIKQNRKTYYCSRKCAGTEKKYKQCPVCGKEFAFGSDRTIYCSRECSYASRRIYANKAESKKAWKEKEKEKLKPIRDAARKEREKKKLVMELTRVLESYIDVKKNEHPCAVCGQLTSRKKYCSQQCANNAENNRRGQRRRAKIRNALIDSNISLPELFNRDNGICWICGTECDWNDKQDRDGTIICGGQYPSIDHVIPLSKGGFHSWSNIRLACRCCNSLKGDTYPPGTSIF